MAAIQERKQPEPRSEFLEAFDKEQDNGSSSSSRFVRYIADRHEPSTEHNRQRRESVFTTPFTICIERARYFTESYKETEGQLPLYRMANAFKHAGRVGGYSVGALLGPGWLRLLI